MDSERLGRKLKPIGWADLPSELLSSISGGLQSPTHTVRFRSVCRSWRSSTPPPPNILYAFLPHTISLSPERFSTDCAGLFTFTTNAVYLLRTPSKPWMVSVQELAPGNLLLRHVLTRQEFKIHPSELSSIELSPVRRSRSNQVARWYTRCAICEKCGEIERADKVVFVPEDPLRNCANPSPQLVGLCQIYDGSALPYVVRLGGRGGDPREITELVEGNSCNVIADFVEFNGRAYAIDAFGNFYVFDHKIPQLLLVVCDPNPGHRYPDSGAGHKRLVVSDGDLYMVYRSYHTPRKWVIFRLVNMDPKSKSKEVTIVRNRCRWEKVKSLGDKVLFISIRYCSFSVPARDLPPPWIGNCVVFVDNLAYPCSCFPKHEMEIEVYHLGPKQPRKLLSTADGTGMSSVQGYFDLFEPPSSLMSINSQDCPNGEGQS